MNKDVLNVRGLLTTLSKKSYEEEYKGYDMFLLQIVHRKVRFDCVISHRHKSEVLEILFDAMQDKDYSEEKADQIVRKLEYISKIPG